MAVIPQSYRVGSAGYGSAGQTGPRYIGQNRTGSIRPAAGPRTSYGTGKHKLDPFKVIVDRIKAMKGQAVPNIQDAYRREADALVGAASEAGEQAEQTMLAQAGNRGGIGAALYAGGERQNQMRAPMADAASLRARGVEAQAALARQRELEFISLMMQFNEMNQAIQRERYARQVAAQQQQQRPGGGGVSGVRIGASAQAGGQMSDPDPWHFILDGFGNLNSAGRAMQQAGTLPTTPPGARR